MNFKAAGAIGICMTGAVLYIGPVYASGQVNAADVLKSATQGPAAEEIQIESIKEVVSMPVGAAA